MKIKISNQRRRQRKRWYDIIWKEYEKSIPDRDHYLPTPRLIEALKRLVRFGYWEADYGYTRWWYSNLEYCSDRMSSGRAKAILRLIEEEVK